MDSQQYVGIDLGTVNSCLAYSDGKGNVEVSIGDDGNDITPSVILFTDFGKVIGRKAIDDAGKYNTTNYISYFKRQMGTNITRNIRSVSYTPTEMSAMILTKLVSDFEKESGTRLDKAVITVPCDYGDAERSATVDAAKIAGIMEVELLNESVAAALSYGMGRGDKTDRTIIVYDLGGGTFDATVLKISDGKFTVLSSEGSKNLGGRDWDLQLASIMEKKILDSAGLTSDDIESDSDIRGRMLRDAEKQKELLTYQDRAVGNVDIYGKTITYTVTREELDESTMWLMSQTIDMVGFALRNAKLEMNQIDEIVLVGGATLMPQVMRELEDAYPSTGIEFFDPEHAVARGAALYAESVFGSVKMTVTPVLTKSFGVLAGIDGVERVCNILFRDVPLPMDSTLMCRPKRDDQKELQISVYESLAKTGDDFIDISNARAVETFTIPMDGKVSRGRTKIAVRFSADRDGRLSVSVDCNGKLQKCDMSKDTSMSNRDIIDSRSKMAGVI